MKQITKNAFFNALGTALYVSGVGFFMYYGTLIKIGRKNTFLAPISLLMLFVFSAALTGYLIFGKPALLYIDGKKERRHHPFDLYVNLFFHYYFYCLTIVNTT